jgi:hypothetical protein
MSKITKREVDSARRAGAEYFIWDDELRGFGLRVLPSGAKSYVVQFRVKGRQRRISIGLHGRFTPDQARRKAFDLLNQVAQGEDPGAARELDRKSITVREFAAVYLRDAGKGLVTYRGKPKKTST